MLQFSLTAQTISGTITDKNDEPLIGASVLVKASTTGTVTDFDGKYTLDVQGGTVLIVSYTGYLTQEIAIGASTTLNIVMETDAALLSEIVVTGYGSQRKENLTGSVGVITAKALEARPITNATQSLQGQVSGVWVNQNSGEPGEDAADIRIRGIGTLNDANPLILVDGIEAPFGNIDPNDIESITVLKDAASAAIYGSRAANGVVLITTKRGTRNSKPTFSYTGYAGTTQSAVVPDYIWDSEQFMRLRNEADINSGKTPHFIPDDVIAQYQDGPNTNWFEEVFRNAAIQQHNLSVSGGSDKNQLQHFIGLF
ncbi:MAG: SusC/RagA family TonB-linked outer membrane protein [Saprospiraceae bacterium]|nr:SusC/RagA family TonB-linked outer membrane protein [Saprospiraceae bacterium]